MGIKSQSKLPPVYQQHTHCWMLIIPFELTSFSCNNEIQIVCLARTDCQNCRSFHFPSGLLSHMESCEHTLCKHYVTGLKTIKQTVNKVLCSST